MYKEYFPQAYNLGGAVMVKDINNPFRTFTLFKDSEVKTWYDSMNKASWMMEQKENPLVEDYLPAIRAACENKRRRAEFEIVFYGSIQNEDVLYFL